jgi:hypothetical protein
MADDKARQGETPEASPKAKASVAPRAKPRKKSVNASKRGPRVIVSAETLPRKSLEQALRVAKALREVLAGGPASWQQVATAMGIAPGAQVNKYASSAESVGRSRLR